MPWGAYSGADTPHALVVKREWDGGVNTRAPLDRLGPNEMAHALNIELRRGIPETRRGLRKLAWLHQADGSSLGIPQGMAGVRFPHGSIAPGARAVLGVWGRSLYLCAPHNLPRLLAADFCAVNAKVRFIQTLSEVIILRAPDAPMRFRPGVDAAPLAMPAGVPSSGTRAMPNFGLGCFAGDRLWLADGDTVIASDVLDWVYVAAQTSYTLTSGEADAILHVRPYGRDTILVAKRDSWWAIEGIQAMNPSVSPSDPSYAQPQIRKLPAAKGPVSGDAIVQIGATVWYLTREGWEPLDLSESGVIRQTAERISDPAKRYLHAVHWEVAGQAIGAFHKDTLLLAIPGRLDNASEDDDGSSVLYVPVAPTLTYENPNAFRIVLRWTCASVYQSYAIERSDDGLTWAPLGTVRGGRAVYVDDTVLPDDTYTYRVRGEDASQHGPWAEIEATTMEWQGPENVAGTSNILAHVLVTWDADPHATGYRIYRASTNSFGSATLLGTSTTTSYQDTTSPYDTLQYFWVKSTRDAVVSLESASGTGTRRDPFSVSATDAGGGTKYWEATEDYGGRTLTARIYKNASTQAWLWLSFDCLNGANFSYELYVNGSLVDSDYTTGNPLNGQKGPTRAATTGHVWRLRTGHISGSPSGPTLDLLTATFTADGAIVTSPNA